MFLFKMLTICIIVVAILLISVVLLQEPKDRIMAPGSSMAVHQIGLNQKADFLEKATWVLTSLLLGLTLLSAISLKYATQSSLPVNIAQKKGTETTSSKADATGCKTDESEKK